jgi:hypothetical protein
MLALPWLLFLHARFLFFFGLCVFDNKTSNNEWGCSFFVVCGQMVYCIHCIMQKWYHPSNAPTPQWRHGGLVDVEC